MRLSPIGENTERLRSSIEQVLLAQYSGQDQVATVPPPDLNWVNHLLYLRQGIDAGLLPAGELQAVESRGLVLLNQVLEELKGRTRCPHCRLPSKTITHCSECKRPISTRRSFSEGGPAGGKS